MEVYTVVILGSRETSSPLLWLFSVFIARLLNVKCRRSPESEDQSPNLSQGVQLPFAFHCPNPAFLNLRLLLEYFFSAHIQECISRVSSKTIIFLLAHASILRTQFFLSCCLEDMINLCISVWQQLFLSWSFRIQQKRYKILLVYCFLCKKA